MSTKPRHCWVCLLIERFVNKLITGLSIKKGLTPGRRCFLDLVRPLMCQQSPVIIGLKRNMQLDKVGQNALLYISKAGHIVKVKNRRFSDDNLYLHF